MLNGELIAINNIISGIQMPSDVTTDDLFDFLSAKSDMESSVEDLNRKIETFRKESKPAGDEEMKEGSKEWQEWNDKFQSLYVKLANEENTTFQPRPISKALFTSIAKGKTVAEIMLMKKGFGL